MAQVDVGALGPSNVSQVDDICRMRRPGSGRSAALHVTDGAKRVRVQILADLSRG